MKQRLWKSHDQSAQISEWGWFGKAKRSCVLFFAAKWHCSRPSKSPPTKRDGASGLSLWVSSAFTRGNPLRGTKTHPMGVMRGLDPGGSFQGVDEGLGLGQCRPIHPSFGLKGHPWACPLGPRWGVSVDSRCGAVLGGKHPLHLRHEEVGSPFLRPRGPSQGMSTRCKVGSTHRFEEWGSPWREATLASASRRGRFILPPASRAIPGPVQFFWKIMEIT